MKRLLIGFMAFALTLGVACKKDAVVQPESSVSKKEFAVKDLVKPVTTSIADDTEILPNPGEGGTIGGQNTYPHSTGLCYCGVYSVCHPVKHNSSCPAALGTGGCTGCPKSGG